MEARLFEGRLMAAGTFHSAGENIRLRPFIQLGAIRELAVHQVLPESITGL